MQSCEIDTIRRQAILSSLAGFPFLLIFSLVWILAASLSYVVPSDIAPWLYPLLGLPAVPVAILLERKMGYVRAEPSDPLLPLTLQILFVQIVAFPAVVLVWSFSPNYLPVAFAAVVGGHFLPFQWVYRTHVYGVLGFVVAAGPYIIAIMVGEDAVHYTGFFVGAVLFVGALRVRSHAAATWRASRTTADGQIDLAPAEPGK